MTDNNLNGELLQFKEFINRHPKLIRKIRQDGKSWQEIYEQWVILGEEDALWEKFKEDDDDSLEKEDRTEKIFSAFDLKPELVDQIVKYTKSIDINKLQGQVQQLSKTINTIQEIVDKYQQTNKSSNRMGRPYNWFTD